MYNSGVIPARFIETRLLTQRNLSKQLARVHFDSYREWGGIVHRTRLNPVVLKMKAYCQ